MSLTLTDMFGAGSTNNAGTVSFNLTTIATATNFNGDVSNATASQIVAMLTMYWAQQTTAFTDDATKLVTASQGFQSIVVRGGVSQIAHTYNVNIHTPNTSATLDPDSVV